MADSLTVRLAAIRLLVLDVDGVLTDGRIYYDDQGREFKSFHVQDGAALKRVQAAGVACAIISGRNSPAVTRRAAELGIEHIYQGHADKLPALADLLQQTGVAASACAHIGDDIADLALFDQVGVALSVADAHPQVRTQADHVASLNGGQGAVRELCDLLLDARAPQWRPA